MLSRSTLVVFSLILTMTAIRSARGAEEALTADVEVFYPFPAVRSRGGGVAPMGDATMELVDAGQSPDGKGMLRLSGRQAPVQGAWWFPSHLPLTPEQALIGEPGARIVLEVEAATPRRTEVSLHWRVDGAVGETVRSGPAAIGPKQPTRVELPVPDLAPGSKINGLVIAFADAGEYRIRKLGLGRRSPALVDPIEPEALRQARSVTITGRAAAGVQSVTLRFEPQGEGADAVEKSAPVRQGRFELPISQQDLKPGRAYSVTAAPANDARAVSPAQRLFVFPTLTGKESPPVTRQGADLIREGKRFGFVGVNYSSFLLGLSINPDYEMIAQDLLQMHDWGVRVVRVPLHIGMVQPALGVMPDDPRYAELMRKHRMDPSYVDQLDYFVALAGELGIYTIIDWHGMPTDPYRYFVGGTAQDRGTGKPGTAVAYLAPSPTEAGEFDLSNPTHVESLLNAHTWIARHYRGNPNLLGIEIPFNEPHTTYMAVEANWRRIVDLTAQAVAEGDPERMTFWIGPSYGHNNLLSSATWLQPDRATGGGPHFYQANGPVPTRPDAQTMREPWLARETEGTFGWSFPAVIMPLSAADYPFYNGETGAHGAQMVLPDRNREEAASVLIEAQLVQEYATGMAGRLEWTLWRNPGNFHPYVPIYRTLFRRFAPVYEAGPIDRMKAKVAFVQHPEAVPSSNGHNFACIPFIKAALDLHLPHVHYLTDDQFCYYASAELSVGLEQVVETAESLAYKAIIVDRRHLSPQAVSVLERTDAPVLWLDRAEDLTAEKLAAFLEQAGVAVDAKSPRELQLVEGPEHLIVYRRLDGGENPARAYPRLNRTGIIALVDEAGQTVFRGSTEQLIEQGIEVDLPLWRSAIYRIETR